MSVTLGGHPKLTPHRLAALTAGCLLIDDAHACGLIDGGPIVDRRRCGQVLAQLEREGVVPTEEEAAAAAIELMAELGVIRS